MSFGKEIKSMKRSVPTQCRNPFNVTYVPSIARLYLWAHGSQGLDFFSRLRRFIGPKLYMFFRGMHSLSSRGTFQYELNGQHVLLEFNGENTQFHSLYDRPYRYGYEIETAMALDSLADENAVFYDIGSNWGHFSLFLASRPDYEGKIFAFEPFAPSFRDLQSIVQQADLSKRVSTYHLALSDFDGTSSMTLPDGIRSGLASLSSAGDDHEGTTKVAKLDSLELDPPSLMKLDVEGNEARVVLGGRKTIAKHAPHIIFEHHRQELDSSFAIFDELTRQHYLFYIPALEFKAGKNILRVSYGEDYADLIDRYGAYKFCLIQMKAEDRCLYPPQLDILAVHEKKVKLIRHLFPGAS